MAPLAFLCLAYVAAAVQSQHANGSSYDEVEAKKFASLSSVAYCADTEQVLNWTCTACADSRTPLLPGKIKIIDAGPSDSFRIVIGKLQEEAGCLMAFRGSHNVKNFISDFKAWKTQPSTFEECDGCKVHSGFYSLWKSVQGLAVNALKEVGCSPTSTSGSVVYMTGHSLGAAITHLAMFTLESAGFTVPKTYSFEAPRVGNQAFVDAFTARFMRQHPVFRLTHYMDPVPHLPLQSFGYTHVDTEVYYDKDGNYTVCGTTEDKSCSNQHGDVLRDLLHAGEHCASNLVPNGQICYPEGCSTTSTPSARDLHV